MASLPSLESLKAQGEGQTGPPSSWKKKVSQDVGDTSKVTRRDEDHDLDLTKCTVKDLEEVIRRESALLNNPRLIRSLPDRGAKLKSKVAQVEEELRQRALNSKSERSLPFRTALLQNEIEGLEWKQYRPNRTPVSEARSSPVALQGSYDEALIPLPSDHKAVLPLDWEESLHKTEEEKARAIIRMDKQLEIERLERARNPTPTGGLTAPYKKIKFTILDDSSSSGGISDDDDNGVINELDSDDDPYPPDDDNTGGDLSNLVNATLNLS